MNKTMRLATGCLAAAMLGSGCAAFRSSQKDLDVSKDKHYDADYDYTDLRSYADSMVKSVLGRPPWPSGDSPILIMYGIENRTEQHADMKGLEDKIRTALINQGGVKFVNRERRDELLREQGYEQKFVDASMQKQIGVQAGAKYMMTGSLIEVSTARPREVRVSKVEMKYYKLTMELTDLESNLIVWTDEREIAREASRPLIGW